MRVVQFSGGVAGNSNSISMVQDGAAEPAGGWLAQPLAPAQRYRSGNKYNKTIPSKQN